jgi:dCMP deaminase
MSRPTRLETYKVILDALAARSTCLRAHTATILVLERNIISCGYNGPPPGVPPCIPELCTPGCSVSRHAERNAIARSPIILRDTDLDVTLITLLAPCVHCAQLILECTSIKRVIYFDAYRLTAGVELLTSAGVSCLWTVQHLALDV